MPAKLESDATQARRVVCERITLSLWLLKYWGFKVCD